VALRLRDGRRLDPLPVDEALARIRALTEGRGVRLWDDVDADPAPDPAR